MRKDLPCPVLGIAGHGGPLHSTLRINGHDDTLRSETFGGSFDELRVLDRRGIDTDFVGTCIQQGSDVVESSYASSHCKGHEDLLSGPSDHIKNGLAVFVRGGDIQKT